MEEFQNANLGLVDLTDFIQPEFQSTIYFFMEIFYAFGQEKQWQGSLFLKLN